jgi:hypothetical protein
MKVPHTRQLASAAFAALSAPQRPRDLARSALNGHLMIFRADHAPVVGSSFSVMHVVPLPDRKDAAADKAGGAAPGAAPAAVKKTSRIREDPELESPYDHIPVFSRTISGFPCSFAGWKITHNAEHISEPKLCTAGFEMRPQH